MAVVGIFFAVVGTLLAVVLGPLALIVLLPFHAWGRGAIGDGIPSGEAGFVWAFGAFGIDASSEHGLAVRLFGIRLWQGPVRRREKPKEKKPKKEGKRKSVRARELLSHRGALLRMARELARTLRLRLRIAGTVGLDDPADTAALSVAMQVLALTPGVDLQLGWNWVEEQLDLEAVGTARVWLAHLAFVFVTLLLDAENRAALRALRGRRRESLETVAPVRVPSSS